MTEQEIIDGNKLICTFMGGETSNDMGETFYHNLEAIHYEDEDFGNAKDLKYHSSWDWLMPVLRKIATIQFDDVPSQDPNDVSNYPYLRTFESYPKALVRINRMMLYEANDIHSAAWMAAVDYIKWHNENNS